MEIEVHCDNVHCTNTTSVELPFVGLSEADVRVVWEKERQRRVVKEVQITPPKPQKAWIDENRDYLEQSEIEDIERDGFFTLWGDRIPRNPCPSCGSD